MTLYHYLEQRSPLVFTFPHHSPPSANPTQTMIMCSVANKYLFCHKTYLQWSIRSYFVQICIQQWNSLPVVSTSYCFPSIITLVQFYILRLGCFWVQLPTAGFSHSSCGRLMYVASSDLAWPPHSAPVASSPVLLWLVGNCTRRGDCVN